MTGSFNALAVAIFAAVLAVTLLITRWAAKRTHSTTEFYAAGRGIAGAANGIAITGDYLSASTFLGYAGLMYLYGFDGWVFGLGALLSFLPILYLLADNGKNFTSLRDDQQLTIAVTFRGPLHAPPLATFAAPTQTNQPGQPAQLRRPAARHRRRAAVGLSASRQQHPRLLQPRRQPRDRLDGVFRAVRIFHSFVVRPGLADRSPHGASPDADDVGAQRETDRGGS